MRLSVRTRLVASVRPGSAVQSTTGGNSLPVELAWTVPREEAKPAYFQSSVGLGLVQALLEAEEEVEGLERGEVFEVRGAKLRCDFGLEIFDL